MPNLNCVICGETIRRGYDHNASPVAEGRCCSYCNSCVVIPTRLKHLLGGQSNAKT